MQTRAEQHGCAANSPTASQRSPDQLQSTSTWLGMLVCHVYPNASVTAMVLHIKPGRQGPQGFDGLEFKVYLRLALDCALNGPMLQNVAAGRPGIGLHWMARLVCHGPGCKGWNKHSPPSHASTVSHARRDRPCQQCLQATLPRPSASSSPGPSQSTHALAYAEDAACADGRGPGTLGLLGQWGREWGARATRILLFVLSSIEHAIQTEHTANLEKNEQNPGSAARASSWP